MNEETRSRFDRARDEVLVMSTLLHVRDGLQGKGHLANDSKEHMAELLTAAGKMAQHLFKNLGVPTNGVPTHNELTEAIRCVEKALRLAEDTAHAHPHVNMCVIGNLKDALPTLRRMIE